MIPVLFAVVLLQAARSAPLLPLDGPAVPKAHTPVRGWRFCRSSASPPSGVADKQRNQAFCPTCFAGVLVLSAPAAWCSGFLLQAASRPIHGPEAAAGRCVDIGEWVLREACQEAIHWQSELMVSVNVSPAQFSHPDMIGQVQRALVDTGLPAERLELEITENVMLNDVEGALKTMHALKELGVRLNMDDFGTGYSSLGYLRTYPFDSIKIDQRFIASLDKTDRDRSIVQAIIGLGRALNLMVTAEGVETEGQLRILAEEGCGEVQGFLFSEPMRRDALEQLLNLAVPSPGATQQA
ncbi:EAL domain-containing protein [Pseudomonas sp. BN414]|nr:EAL domain-containing protein [Pseudomonas sp. BN414]